MDVTPNRSRHQIKNGDVLLTYIGLLTMGKPAFESVHEFDDDPDFYKYALGIVRSIPSEETLRQRMDDTGSSMRSYILAENIRMLKDSGIVPGKLPNGYVLVDIGGFEEFIPVEWDTKLDEWLELPDKKKLLQESAVNVEVSR